MAGVAVVTGAGRGIGAATAVELGCRGWKVAVNYRRSSEAAQEVVERIRTAGSEAVAIGADVTTAEGSCDLVERTVTAFGRVDSLVCNATRTVHFGEVADITWEDFRAEVDDELAAAFHPTRAVLPGFTADGAGRIVYVSSEMAEHAAMPGGVAHGTAKAALNAFARYVATTYGPAGVVANVVSPGPVHTTASEDVLSGEVGEELARRTPRRRLAGPEDVAVAVAVLATDGGTMLTGATIPVSGGRHLSR